MIGELTLGPLLLHWPGETWRDFYFRIADEAPVEAVYLGEVVCPKRLPFQEPHVPEVVERLQAAGKTIVLSTPALVVDPRDLALIEDAAGTDDFLVEANDVAALGHLDGRPHTVGPYVNVYNESTLAHLAARGAVRATLPVELPARSVRVLAAVAEPEVEVQVFGRWPLAISARCYHARAYGRTKDACQYACAEDADGLPVETLDGQAFLAVNGVQTQSHAYGCLIEQLPELQEAGVRGFRLSPQAIDMVRVSEIFRGVLDGALAPDAGLARLDELRGEIPLANGFFREREGAAYVAGS